MRFAIYCRSMGDAPWELYGEFNNEIEFARELPNIRQLGLYTKRVNLPKKQAAGH